MKTIDTTQVCPYTGLRSFTEEESLYFKGRDGQVDQITAQLEERKFLMLTGASGEGKSSLIYAGLIPNARAGFFKAKYGQWKVVDFRPERSPIRNLSTALDGVFGLGVESIETEMRRGFASLIDLYLNSDFYINEEDPSWISLAESERKTKKRTATNLLIIVDQFEEFFTNPENYSRDTPSQDSQIVVNLMLETARIALQQKLPVYVVCTMRSDYIGQCSSFRGLAEYIGYSQFFVPRLKRNELRQVIEEPALLSGNRISRRLTERLVYDLAEGVDQLPILQHALSQIWLAANGGMEEMDLIHYAMVGGMPASELPDEEKDRFQNWFDQLPEYQKQFYAQTGLNKVIENHANRLYESAADRYNELYPETPISNRDAKNIIAIAFACLTRIDNSRAVRNRMSIDEIAEIIHRPGLTAEIVGRVLDPFRDESNSFVRPFRNDDSPSLPSSAVLDITHESLIRNWERLNRWASKEHAFYGTFLDLKKQLDRWKQNKRSTGYLLPVGTLTYFENWYETCKPNVGWVRRYAERKGEPAEITKAAETTLDDINSFLKKSANRVRVSRAFVRYGAETVIVGISLALMIVICGWYWFEASKKKNDRVITTVQEDAKPLLASPEVTDRVKATYLIRQERLVPGSAMEFIAGMKEGSASLSLELYKQLKVVDKKYSGTLRKSLVDKIALELTSTDQVASRRQYIDQANTFIYVLALDNYYAPDDHIQSVLIDQSKKAAKAALNYLQGKSDYSSVVASTLNQALLNWLTFGNPSVTETKSVVDAISPLSGEKASETFDFFYRKGSVEGAGLRGLNFNGGYHLLASLYAVLGDETGLKWCFDQLKLQPDYFAHRLNNDFLNILGYLYQYNHREMLPKTIAEIQSIAPANSSLAIYRDLIYKSAFISSLYRINLFKDGARASTESGVININLCFAPRDMTSKIISDYERELSNIKSAPERNFSLAIHYKRIAIFEDKYAFDRGLPVSQAALFELLDKAWNHFKSVDDSYLAEETNITYVELANRVTATMTRREQFIYPDDLDVVSVSPYQTDLFMRYVLKRGRFNDAYAKTRDLDQVGFWLSNIRGIGAFAIIYAMTNDFPVSDSVLVSLADRLSSHAQAANVDANQLYIILANRALATGDTTAGFQLHSQIKWNKMDKSAAQFGTWRDTRFRNDVMDLASFLATYGKYSESLRLIESAKEDISRVLLYTTVANRMYDHGYNPRTFVFLDSALSIYRRMPTKDFLFELEYRHRFVEIMEKIGGDKMKMFSKEFLRDTRESRKVLSINAMVNGICERGDYYEAMTAIPPTLTEGEDLACKGVLINAASKRLESASGTPGWPALDRFDTIGKFINFFGIPL